MESNTKINIIPSGLDPGLQPRLLPVPSVHCTESAIVAGLATPLCWGGVLALLVFNASFVSI